DGAFEANGIELDSLGGRINADLTVHDLDATPTGRVRAALHGISLHSAQQTLRPELREVVVTGVLDGTAEAVWNGSLSNVRVRSDLAISAEAKNASSSASQLPIDGIIHASY